MTTRVNTPGTAMLVRIATEMSPRSNTTICPLSMSVATARNGIGNWSKLFAVRAPRTRPLRTSSMFCVSSTPPATFKDPPF